MADRTASKMLHPEEQLMQLIRQVRQMWQERRLYTRLQGIRLESRMVLGERQLWAVVDDPTATNDGASWQITP